MESHSFSEQHQAGSARTATANPAAARPEERRPGCLRCRQRHVKCDKAKPLCSRCKKAHFITPCAYDWKKPLHIRQSRYSSLISDLHRKTRDCQADDPLDDLVEALPNDPGYLSGFYGHGVQLPNDQQSPNEAIEGGPPVAHSLTPDSQTRSQSTADHCTPIRGSRFPSADGRYVHSSASPSSFSDRIPTTDRDNRASSTAGITSSLQWNVSSKTPKACTRTLHDAVECKVFDFYVTSAGHWLDIGSPHHYFQSYIPQLALVEPLVFYACLACASHIMFLMGKIDKQIEEYYNGKVLELLIPLVSSERATSANESLLATTVILRMSEQFLDVSKDSQRHLNGAASLFFMEGTCWPPIDDSLATACFWTHLRESIRICFLREQSWQFDFNHINVSDEEMGLPAKSDEVWTNRMTYLLLRVCTTCWSTSSSKSEKNGIMRRLQIGISAWRDSLPSSFRPWCAHYDGKDPFPTIQHFSSWHVVAWQFYYTAKVMLAIYCTEDHPSSRDLRDVMHYIEAKVIAPTRWLCGLCISSTSNAGINFNGSHLMAWCGQFLSSQQEQERLLQFLVDFERETKWSNQTSCKRLEEVWKVSYRCWDAC